MESNKTYYIYVLIDPSTDEVRYVGCTINPDRRYDQHTRLQGCQHPDNERGKWLRELQQKSLQPQMKIIEICTPENKISVERKWVDHFLAMGVSLVNTLDNPQNNTLYRVREVMKLEDKRKIAISTVKAELERLQIDSKYVGVIDALAILRRLIRNNPNSIASKWYVASTKHQLHLFTVEWDTLR